MATDTNIEKPTVQLLSVMEAAGSDAAENENDELQLAVAAYIRNRNFAEEFPNNQIVARNYAQAREHLDEIFNNVYRAVSA